MNAGQHFLIDGLNVCRLQEDHIKLSTLLTLLIALVQKGHSFFCVFDQCAYRLFERQGTDNLALYDALRKHVNYFSQIDKEADKKILMMATEHPHCSIITNDSFKQYRSSFPWLLEQPQRLVSLSIMGDHVIVDSLGLLATDSNNADDLFRELAGLLSSASPTAFLSGATPNRATRSKPREKRAAPQRRHRQDQPAHRPPKPTPAAVEPRPTKSDPIDNLLSAGLITSEVADVLRIGMTGEVNGGLLDTNKTEVVAIVLAIDKSNSMGTLVSAVIDGQRHMLNALLGASTHSFDIFLAQILFDQQVHVLQPFARFRGRDPNTTSDAVVLLNASNYAPSGYTALRDAALRGLCLLAPVIAKAYEDNTTIETRLCILTDGMDWGPAGLGSGSAVGTTDLRDAITCMLDNGTVNNVILAGVGDHDYRSVAAEMGIRNVIQVDRDARGIRRAFELFSSISE